MKFSIELDGTEPVPMVERIVGALIVMYDLQPHASQLSVNSIVGGISETVAGDAAAVEAHLLGNGPAQAETTTGIADLQMTNSRPPPPPPIDTTSLGFGSTHGSPDPGPTMQVPPPPPTGDVDSAGVRWDAARHAANKAKKGDGTWKAKRGLTSESVADAQRVDSIPPPPPTAATQGVPEDPAALFDWADTEGVTIARLQAAFKTVGLVDANGEGSIPLLLSRPDFTGAVYAELTK